MLRLRSPAFAEGERIRTRKKTMRIVGIYGCKWKLPPHGHPHLWVGFLRAVGVSVTMQIGINGG